MDTPLKRAHEGGGRSASLVVSIVVYTSRAALSLSRARALPRSSRGLCWNSSQLPYPLSWSIAVDPESLWFVCSLPGGRVLASPAGCRAFVEGLWNGDVAELFIKGTDGRYQEFNLAPSGSWWSMTLSDYRKRETSPLRPELSGVELRVEEGQWEVVSSFKRRTLDVDLLPGCRVHVAGMWYRPEPIFLSSHPPSGVKPDYHLHECFEPIALVPVPG